MGLLLPGLSIEVVIYCDTPLVFCKAIFLKVVKVVYFYRLVYVLIQRSSLWQLSHSISTWFVHGFTPGRGKPRPYKGAWGVVGWVDPGGLGRRGAVLKARIIPQ
jgi:hypothetical protein